MCLSQKNWCLVQDTRVIWRYNGDRNLLWCVFVDYGLYVPAAFCSIHLSSFCLINFDNVSHGCLFNVSFGLFFIVNTNNREDLKNNGYLP